MISIGLQFEEKKAIEPELYGSFSARKQAEQKQQAVWAHQVFGDDTFPLYPAPNEAEAKEHVHFKSLRNTPQPWKK